MKILFFSISFILLSFAPASADDFFAQEDEEANQEETDSTNEFTILNAFEGEKSAEEIAENKRKEKLPWAEFEDVSGTQVEKNFLKSDEVKLRRELRKPLPQRKPFGNSMDSLEDSVNNLKAPSVIDTLRK